jgi:hypothetical protein
LVGAALGVIVIKDDDEGPCEAIKDGTLLPVPVGDPDEAVKDGTLLLVTLGVADGVTLGAIEGPNEAVKDGTLLPSKFGAAEGVDTARIIS